MNFNKGQKQSIIYSQLDLVSLPLVEASFLSKEFCSFFAKQSLTFLPPDWLVDSRNLSARPAPSVSLLFSYSPVPVTLLSLHTPSSRLMICV